MTHDADELRSLIASTTQSDLLDGGRYFSDDCTDLTQCNHGDTGEYQNRADGELVQWLWNRRHEILTMYTEKDAMTKHYEHVKKVLGQ